MKFCKKCQKETERYGDVGRCKPCAKKYSDKNKGRKQIANAARYAANPDRVNEASAAWRAANFDRYESSRIAWRAANKYRAKTATAAWRAANPERVRIQSNNRRARKKWNGGLLSRGISERLFKLQKGKCACCKNPLGNNYHLDHIVPLALGGANADNNVQLLRASCNMQKSAKHPVDFMRSRGFLL